MTDKTEPLRLPALRPSPLSLDRTERGRDGASAPPAALRREAALTFWDEVLRTASAAAAGRIRAGTPKAPPKRVADELGFVLHAWPWRESSLVADVLTLRYGRVFLVAKGAKRQASPLRGLLVPFAPLRLAWSGRNEAKVLTKADWMGSLAPLSGEALLSGFYMNEMVLKLTEREDPQPRLFGAYVEALHALGTAERLDRQRVLRVFELAMLDALGWGLSKPEGSAVAYVVRSGALCALHPHEAPRPHEAVYAPELVDALLKRDFSDARALRAARDILRETVGYHLGGRELHARRILGELARL